MFARFCKDTGWATFVGRTTKGGGLVSAFSPSVIRLNNTGLLFWFFAESSINKVVLMKMELLMFYEALHEITLQNPMKRYWMPASV